MHLLTWSHPPHPMDSRVCVQWVWRRWEQPLPLTMETLCPGARPWAYPNQYGWKLFAWADNCMVWNCRWNFLLLLLLLLLGRVSNAPHFTVDVVACDFQCRYNFSSHVDQIFDEALLAASIVHSNMSDDFSCIQSDHRISHLAAKFIKPPILSSFVGIILRLAAILSRWMHGDSVPFDCSAKETRQWKCSNGAGGARIASNSNKNSSLKFFKIFIVCKSCV